MSVETRREESRQTGGHVAFEANSSIDFQFYQQHKESETLRKPDVKFLPTFSSVQAFHKVHLIGMTAPVLCVFLAKITTSNKQLYFINRVSDSHCCVKILMYDLSYCFLTVGTLSDAGPFRHQRKL